VNRDIITFAVGPDPKVEGSTEVRFSVTPTQMMSLALQMVACAERQHRANLDISQDEMKATTFRRFHDMFKVEVGMRVQSLTGDISGKVVAVGSDAVTLHDLSGYKLKTGERPEFFCAMVNGVHDGSTFVPFTN
jgi:hypothetical protein